MKLLVFGIACAVVVAVVAHADEKPEDLPGKPGVIVPLQFDAAPASGEPSPWACDLSTLIDGKRCHFDAKGDAHIKSDAAVAALTGKVCARLSALRGEPAEADSDALCHEEIGRVAKTCTATALVDEQDRFLATQSGCYKALRAAVDAVRQAGETWSGCCRCLAAAKCTASFSGCALGMAKGPLPKVTRACLDDKCATACVPAAPLLFAPPPPLKVKGQNPSDGTTPTSVDL